MAEVLSVQFSSIHVRFVVFTARRDCNELFFFYRHVSERYVMHATDDDDNDEQKGHDA